MDAESERVVQKALDDLMRDRTSIVVTHRLSTDIDADRIAVHDRGKLAALGTHRELLEESELYNQLARLQFREHEETQKLMKVVEV